MKYLISDYDNTIVKNRNIESENLQAIQTIMKSEEHSFVIATGRAVDMFFKASKELQIPFDYVILLNGAVIMDAQKNMLRTITVPSDIIEDNLQCCLKLQDEHNLKVAVSTLEELFIMETKDRLIEFLNRKERQSDTYIGMCVEVLSKDLEETDEIRKKLNAFNAGVLQAVTNNWFVDLLDPRVSKGQAIRFLMDKLQASSEDVYVIGDSYNDMSMFEITENSYTFDDSPELVQKKAMHVVPSFHACVKDFIKEAITK